MTSGAARYAVLAFLPGELSWTQAAFAYGLTHAEAGFFAALARHGNVKLAARDRNIAYETARKFLAAAMLKTGSSRQAELIHRTLLVAAGDVPEPDNLHRLIEDLFGLSDRQAMLAVLIATGASRSRAASHLNISDRRAKAECETIFEICGVSSAANLARVIAELNALKALALACDLGIRLRKDSDECLRFLQRSSGCGKIAIADYGPVGATPVVLFHSNTSGRHQSRSFVAALRHAGFRPIAVERAGYGLSDPLAGDPIANAVSDVREVLKALKLPNAMAMSRSITGALVAAAAHQAGLVSGGILLVPDPPVQSRRRPNTLMDQAKKLIFQHAELADAFARMVTRRINAAVIEQIFRSSLAGSPSDKAVLDHPRRACRYCPWGKTMCHEYARTADRSRSAGATSATSSATGRKPLHGDHGCRRPAVFNP